MGFSNITLYFSAKCPTLSPSPYSTYDGINVTSSVIDASASVPDTLHTFDESSKINNSATYDEDEVGKVNEVN